MSASNKVFVNSSTPACEDADLNGFNNENNNLIIGSGQTLSPADNQQTHKAVSIYSAGGDYYLDTGTATAYILGVIGLQISPDAYFDGMRIRFIANTTNSGPATINVAGLGIVNLYLNGAAMSANYIVAGEYIEATYGASRFNVNHLSGSSSEIISGVWDFINGFSAGSIMKAGLSASGAEVLSIGKSTIENWVAGFTALQVGGLASILSATTEGTGNITRILNNAYYDTGFKAIVNDEATSFESLNGVFSWHSAPAVAADTAITFTEVMKAGLSASGAEVLSIGKGAFENWGSAFSILQIGGMGAIYGTQAESVNSATGISSNTCADKYISNAAASYYAQQAGTHVWSAAISGTADAAITWIELHRSGLSASGAEVLSIGKGTFENTHGTLSALQLGGNAALVASQAEGGSGTLWIAQNTYNDGNWRYISNAAASVYAQQAGTHVWSTKSSGTADTPVNFTEVMRIESDGSVEVGAGLTNQGIGTLNTLNGLYVNNKKLLIGKGALVKKTAVQSIPHGVATYLIFDAEEYDTDAIHDNVTNNDRVTVPVGVTKVRISAQIYMVFDQYTTVTLAIHKNALLYAYAGFATGTNSGVGAGSTNAPVQIMTAELDVVAGDYFKVQAYQTNTAASARNTFATSGTTWLSMELIA
ncbi:MAG: hypothetical protein OEM38_00540 [Gammaproteobacteria bacterium]|nr:hypothetical protein [Gammaproteobacteria bacterium]